MLRNPLIVALMFSGLVFGCSSSKSTTTNPASDDTGTVDDTGPTEDTAPWNTYPPGPYGLEKGNIFPPITMKGYKLGQQPWTDIAIQDYYDPDGSRGVYAIYYVISAEWCVPCQEEAKMLPGFYTNLYHPRGAAFMTGVFENAAHKPSDQATVDRWLAKSGINFDIGADSDAQAMPTDSGAGIPRNYIINPRTMQIYRINTGVNPDATTIPGLNTFLTSMGAPPAPDAGTPATDAATSD